MSATIEQSLFHAGSWIFDAAAQMEASPELSEAQRGAAPEAEASLSFSGPFEGTLHLRSYGRLLPVIAANMLGQDEPPEEFLQLSALGEIANMVCGGLLPLIAPEWVFSQTSPVVTVGREPQAASGQPAATVRMGLGEGWVELRLYLGEVATMAA